MVKRPTSYSCPSTHTAWAFAAATSIYLYLKKPGIIVLIIAAIMSFSRMYLFVHFPTDVLFGVILGVIIAIVSKIVLEKIYSMQKSN